MRLALRASVWYHTRPHIHLSSELLLHDCCPIAAFQPLLTPHDPIARFERCKRLTVRNLLQ